jgi:hypothetical protein
MKKSAIVYATGFSFIFLMLMARATRAQDGAHGSASKDAVKYRYESTWPKLPLPNKWTMEPVTGMYVDKDDHIWVLHRPADFDLDKTENYASLNPPIAECCVRPPAVLEFDREGNLLRSWGGPNTDPNWSATHTILVDKTGVVWLGTPGGVLKYSMDGKFISRLGEKQAKAVDPTLQNNQAHNIAGQPAGIELDENAHELYLADGYVNKRVVVWDSETGAFKRAWGAYGVSIDQIDNNPAPTHDPSGPPAKQFRNPVHCVHLSHDGFVYVCDRGGDRIQVFTKQGKFIKEFFVANNTLDKGSVGSIDFSPDPQQKYLFVSDIMNNVVWILNRNDGSVAGRFGGMGHSGGLFHWLHVATMDSRGNVYTGEVETGKRVQKFVPLN